MTDPHAACLCCGDAATKLCDYIIGFPIVRTIPHKMMCADAMWTCDAPLCDNHATFAHNIFMKVGGRCEHETFDTCPCHSGIKQKECEELPMTIEDAEMLRREAWALLQRQSMRVMT